MSLFKQAFEGDTSSIQTFLQNKGDPNTSDEYDRSLLHWAVKGKQLDVIELLVSYQANINIVDDQERTPLHYAYLYYNDIIITLLAEYGASEESTDMFGFKPNQLHSYLSSPFQHMFKNILTPEPMKTVSKRNMETATHMEVDTESHENEKEKEVDNVNTEEKNKETEKLYIEERQKETKEIQKETKEIQKETEEKNKETKEIQKETKEIQKETKETKTETKEIQHTEHTQHEPNHKTKTDNETMIDIDTSMPSSISTSDISNIPSTSSTAPCIIQQYVLLVSPMRSIRTYDVSFQELYRLLCSQSDVSDEVTPYYLFFKRNNRYRHVFQYKKIWKKQVRQFKDYIPVVFDEYNEDVYLLPLPLPKYNDLFVIEKERNTNAYQLVPLTDDINSSS